MREIVLDTETTGLDADGDDRLVEIGCVELLHLSPTGRTYHQYINPERPMPEEAERVHGISDADLADKPVFAEVVDAFVSFIGDAPLVIHNASFDMGFLNAELRRAGYPILPKDRAVDTLAIARRRFPGAQASLDALCRRFEIDNSDRTVHGALLDAGLLAKVYVELRGGKQPGLDLAGRQAGGGRSGGIGRPRLERSARPHAATDEERAAHAAFLAKLRNPIWLADEESDRSSS